jgi:nitrogen fixation protein FixH
MSNKVKFTYKNLHTHKPVLKVNDDGTFTVLSDGEFTFSSNLKEGTKLVRYREGNKINTQTVLGELKDKQNEN